MFLCEGPKVLRGALAKGCVREVFVEHDRPGTSPVADAARAARIRVTSVSRSVVTALSGTSTPQGVVAIAGMPRAGLDPLDNPSLVTLLADVRDPGNAGALVRSSVAASADAVVFAKGAVDPFNPKTVRAGAGNHFNVAIRHGIGLGDALEGLGRRGLNLVGAVAGAPATPDDVDLTSPLAIVLGNESWGIDPSFAEMLDVNIGIPMPGPSESLNVGIAGSILLFEVVRRRRSSTT